jgi:hypothetical protein
MPQGKESKGILHRQSLNRPPWQGRLSGSGGILFGDGALLRLGGQKPITAQFVGNRLQSHDVLTRKFDLSPQLPPWSRLVRVFT